MRHPYADFIHQVAKPARYLGGEYQSVRKDWGSVASRMVLAFPDLYDIGMSHLGTKILYSVLNRDPRIACERAFAPWPDLERELRQRGLPLVSLESARPLRDFDAVGFSLQYELTYTNVLLMLELGGIPRRAAERGEDAPLVIAGGPTATHPEPMAEFLDAVVIGDGEEKLPELLLAWEDGKRRGLARRERLIELARLGGIYVPSLYATEIDPVAGLEHVARPVVPDAPHPVRRALVEDINRYPFPDDSPVPEAEAVFDRMAIEIARGCTEGCRFCQAGMIYRPVRERDPRAVVDSVLGAVAKSGYDEVSLTALSTADVSCIAPLIHRVSEELAARKVSMSVSSLRAYGLPGEVLDDISRVRAAGLTFAPEAGTQRMRDVISKNITEEDMVATAHRVFSRGFEKPKLYFMIGLPTEEDADVRGIVETGARVRDVGHGYQPRHRVDVTVSVSTHVPKPHTPFQWCAMDGLGEVARKQAILAGLARERRVTLKMHEPHGSFLEGVLGRGDRRLGRVIERAYELGARFDGWDEHLDFGRWLRAFADCGVEPALYLGTIPVTARLPWDHIDVGLAPGFLLREYRRALHDRLSPPCGKPFQAQVHHTNVADAEADRRRLVCYDCGVACDLDRMRKERIDFLRVLGAERPREVAPEPVPPVPAARPSRRPQPRQRIAQGEPRHYRLGFTKLGRSAFTGHLDLVRLLPRVLRRAGLEPHYSQGFHPHPVMSFGPALGLGVASLAEYADVALGDEVAPADLLERLDRVAPSGMRMIGVRRLRPGDPSLAKAIALADYLIALDGDGPWGELEGYADRLVEVERKGGRRSLRLGDAVLDLTWVGAPEVEPRLELPAATRFLRARVRVEGGLRPGEIVSALFGPGATALAVARVGLRGEDLSDPLGGSSGAVPVPPAPVRAEPRARRLPMAGVEATV